MQETFKTTPVAIASTQPAPTLCTSQANLRRKRKGSSTLQVVALRIIEERIRRGRGRAENLSTSIIITTTRTIKKYNSITL
jgi:hypothetical protein